MMKRVLLLWTVVLITAVPLLARGDNEAKGFHPLTYTWATGGDLQYLYPESAYDQNPSVILALDSWYLQPSLSLTNAGERYTAERTDETSATYGGTYTEKEDSISVDSQVLGFYPLGESMVVGGTVSFDTGFSKNYGRWINYHQENDDVTLNYQDSDLEASLGGLAALELGGIQMGIHGGYGYFSDPKVEEFKQYSAPDVTDTPYYYSGTYWGSYSSNQYTLTVPVDQYGYAVIGASSETGPLRYGLGIVGILLQQDASRQYITVDKDGDGFYESVLPKTQWALSTEPWGEGYTAYDYKYTETLWGFSLYPTVTFQASPALDLQLGASWRPVYTTESVSYERTEPDDLTNEIQQEQHGLGNVRTMVSAVWRPGSIWNFRVGSGYAHDRMLRTRLEDVDAAGETSFHPGNVHHYTEINSGTGQFEDDDIISNNVYGGDVNDTHSVLLAAAVEWQPAPKIMLFSKLTGSYDITKSTYYAFDTFNEEIWKEERMRYSPSLNLNAITGLVVELPSGAVFSTSANAVSGELSPWATYAYSDMLPTNDGYVTETPVNDLTWQNNWRININASFTIKR